MLEFHTVQLSEIEVRRKVSPWTETPGYMASDFHGPSHKPLIISMRTHEPTHASNMSTKLVRAGTSWHAQIPLYLLCLHS